MLKSTPDFASRHVKGIIITESKFMTSIKKTTLAGLCALGAFGAVSNANATPTTPTLEISLAETGYSTYTQTGPSPVLVAPSPAFSFGTFSVTVNTGTSTTAPSLDLDSSTISTSSAGTLVVTLSENGLTSPAGASSWLSQFSGNFATGSGTTVELQTYLDTTDTLLNVSNTATLLDTLTAVSTPFSTSGLAQATNTNGTFALTEVMTITTTGAAHLSLDGSVAVPEPASMALLGAGMIGTGIMARRRRASTTTPTDC